ncbi:hypothetical protein ACMSX5_001675 [Cronobacter turicensis]|uniref:Uncharacterized protein n=1 Tax=Cronobacter turicensis (strain DSM 18703 / CCUG 55852 / LMG 23827 / z3032) TaxID=693216 RepID=C9XWG2_CROTZ|nr:MULTISPECIES: hypothetical protein [Cronobacter]CBA28294.1 unknown protein [Cronobacter turicensis z3032]ELQ6126775.1 hypothetical protein [Cronobacter dublinensis]EMD9175797.1 hypothetical protein [Cronobacter turicensis]MDI6474334.1 hypothetical protein [Cronobacter turicensis]MDK1237966.1 hypothetical protein [Cronobacter turicensis]
MDTELISGLVGAVIGGLFTLWGTMIEGRRQQRESDEQAKLSKLNVLIGIKAEITSLNDVYSKRMVKTIESYDCTVPFDHLFPITQNNFSFYESNATELASVDEKTLKAVVGFYASARSLVDSYQMNNVLIVELKRQQTVYLETQSDVHKASFHNSWATCVGYGKGLKEIHNEVMNKITDCLGILDSNISDLYKEEKITLLRKIKKFLAFEK